MHGGRSRAASLLGMVLAFCGAAGCRTVVEAQWVEIGNLMADLNLDHGIIDARGDGRFWSVRIEAVNADLEMYDIRMTFGNGEVFVPSVRHHFQEGSWSRRIDLPGGYRHIRRIEFWYKAAQPGAGPARIVVWGLR
jgi:hypothetical protein